MLKNEINFVSAETQKRIALARISKQITKIALACLVGLIITSVVAIMAQIYVNIRLNKIIANKEDVKTQIAKYNQLESSIETITSRAKIIQPILTQKQKKVTFILSGIEKLSSVGYTMSGSLKLGKKDSFSLEGRCNSSADLATVNSQVENLVSDKVFSFVEISSVNRNQLGAYSLNMVVGK